VDGASSLRNSQISLSAGRRACKPAAKPAIPGVILLHYAFLWPGHTLYLTRSVTGLPTRGRRTATPWVPLQQSLRARSHSLVPGPWWGVGDVAVRPRPTNHQHQPPTRRDVRWRSSCFGVGPTTSYILLINSEALLSSGSKLVKPSICRGLLFCHPLFS
jgi:hypothetical protein